jgi:hypothetical protein
MRALLLTALLLAPPAQAETYKWVDAKGVVNYSNIPPPNAANAATVPDRISNYAPDPSITQAIDVNRRLDMAETEWLQRQWLMAMKQATPPALATELANTYYPAVAFFPARRPPLIRPTFFLPPPKARPVRPARLSRL